MRKKYNLEMTNLYAHLADGNILSCIESALVTYDATSGFASILFSILREHGLYNENGEEFESVYQSIDESLSVIFNSYRNRVVESMQIENSSENRLLLTVHDFIHSSEFSSQITGADNSVMERLMFVRDELAGFKNIVVYLPPFLNDFDYRPEIKTDYRHAKNREQKHEHLLHLHPTVPRNDLLLYNSHDGFTDAVIHRDLWPAVIVCDRTNSLFVPYEEEGDLDELLRIVLYERDWRSHLSTKPRAQQKEASYIFHLSDLHFGKKSVGKKQINDLKRVITHKYEKLDEITRANQIRVIITGDMLDSLEEESLNTLNSFIASIEQAIGERPVCVLGNHDISHPGPFSGLSFFSKTSLREHALEEWLKASSDLKVVRDDVMKTVWFFLNSNAGGQLAQGEIGSEQHALIKRELERFKDTGIHETYKIVFALHHHLFPIKLTEKLELFNIQMQIPLLQLRAPYATLCLLDYQTLFDTIKDEADLVLHGHLHVANSHTEDGVRIVGCGSSTRQSHLNEVGSVFNTLNVIKLNEGKSDIEPTVLYINQASDGTIVEHVYMTV